MVGDYEGLLSSVGGGASSMKMELILYDYNTQSKARTTILDEDVSVIGWDEYDSSFNQALSVTLQSGRRYCAYVQVKANCGIAATAEPGSDWGHHDDPAGHVRYSSIAIDF